MRRVWFNNPRRKVFFSPAFPTTLNLSNFAAKFYEENLRYPDGTTVQCVIADTCIGGVKEAADFDAKFEKEKVGLSLSGTPSWRYGSIYKY